MSMVQDPEHGLPMQQEYFGTDERYTFTFPDGVTFIEYKALSEGDRRKYLKATTKHVKVERGTGDTVLPLDPGGQRVELLKIAITDWNLIKGGSPFPFNIRNLETWLNQASPKIIDTVEREIRTVNSWLADEMNREDVEAEIDRLHEVLAQIDAREAGKDG